MAYLLRDEELFNITIDSEVIKQLVNTFLIRQESMPETSDVENPNSHLYFTIRFDGKGYRLFSLKQLLEHFENAKDIERIIFELESPQSLKSNRRVGSFLELRLDKNENATSFLTVTSDDEEWTNATFSAVKENITRAKNKNNFVRNPITGLLIQVIGLLIGFVISLWCATKISPNLAIENAFLISFLLVLLLFSNLWTHIYQITSKLVSKNYPNVRFYRPQKDQVHWLYKTIVGGILVAITLFIIGKAFSYAGKLLGVFINT